MSEELKEASDIKKLISKNKGDEDPILVAQRFLNIFRQLHIFDTQRREEFNNLILALPPEIRGMFGVLPGGSILQEYVDELEINAGVSRSSPPAKTAGGDSQTVSESQSPLNQIKSSIHGAKGGAETPVVMSGEAKIVAGEAFAKVLADALNTDKDARRIEMQDLIKAIKEGSVSKGGAIVPDERFAKAMAQAFAQALQFSDANKKADIGELIDAVKESKNIVWPDGFDNLSGGFAKALSKAFGEFLDASNAKRHEEIKELIEAIKEAKKSEPTTSLAVDPTSVNLSSKVVVDEAFANTLAQSLAQAFGEQADSKSDDIKELVKALKNNRGMDYEALSQALIKGLRPILPNEPAALSYVPIESDLAPAADKKSSQQKTQYSENIKVSVDDNFAETVAAAVANTIEATEKSRFEQTKILINGFQEAIKNKPIMEGNAAVVSSISGNDELLQKVASEFTQAINELREARLKEQKEIAQAINAINKTLKEKEFGAQNADTGKIISAVAEAQSNALQEISKSQTSNILEMLTAALKESQKTAAEILAEAMKSVNFAPAPTQSYVVESNYSSANKDDEDDDVESDEDELSDNTQPTSFDSLLEKKKRKKKKKKKTEDGVQTNNNQLQTQTNPLQTNVIKKKAEIKNYIKSTFEPARIEEKQVSKSDWGFEEEIASSDQSWLDEKTESAADWGLGDASSNSSPFSSQETENDGVEGQDWEWEYEEDDGSNGNGYSLDEIDGVEGQDWEWEYQEDDEDEDNVDLSESEDLNASFQPESITETSKSSMASNPEYFEESVVEYGPQIPISELRHKTDNVDPYLLNENIGV